MSYRKHIDTTQDANTKRKFLQWKARNIDGTPLEPGIFIKTFYGPNLMTVNKTVSEWLKCMYNTRTNFKIINQQILGTMRGQAMQITFQHDGHKDWNWNIQII